MCRPQNVAEWLLGMLLKMSIASVSYTQHMYSNFVCLTEQISHVAARGCTVIALQVDRHRPSSSGRGKRSGDKTRTRSSGVDDLVICLGEEQKCK